MKKNDKIERLSRTKRTEHNKTVSYKTKNVSKNYFIPECSDY